MSHFLNRNAPKPTVAAGSLTPPQIAGVERHQGTTRIPRSRILKPPIG